MKIRRRGGNPYPDGEPVEITVKKDGRYERALQSHPSTKDDGKEI